MEWLLWIMICKCDPITFEIAQLDNFYLSHRVYYYYLGVGLDEESCPLDGPQPRQSSLGCLATKNQQENECGNKKPRSVDVRNLVTIYWYYMRHNIMWGTPLSQTQEKTYKQAICPFLNG